MFDNQKSKSLHIIKMFIMIVSFLALTTTQIMAKVNPEAEKYISRILKKQVPYRVKVLHYDFVINNVNAFPPGKLTTMVAQYLMDNNLLKGKVFADIGCGCFALGIIANKNSSDTTIGTDNSRYAIQCAKDNLTLHDVKQNIYLFQEDGLKFLLPKFRGKIDIIVAVLPWDSISIDEFKRIDNHKQLLSRAFYDIDDKLITDILSKGFELLTTNGKLFVTSSMRALERIKYLCMKYNIKYTIVKEADLYDDGNIHYILELTKSAK